MDEIYNTLTNGVHKPKKYKLALFLCGSSGTGKTTSKYKFIKDAELTTTFVTLNIDDIWKLTQDKNVKVLFNALIEKTMEDGYSFLFDGTCRDPVYVKHLMSEAKRHGYIVKFGMLYSNLNTALERLKNRKTQPLKEEIAKSIYTQVSIVAE